VQELFAETVTPMCSPRLLEGAKPLRSPNDLRNHTLLHDDSLSFDKAAPDWSAWLKAAGAKGIDVRRGPRFSHPDHAMQAAMDEAGVVLGWQNLAASDLAAGRLVMPFDLKLPMQLGFFLVSSFVSASRPKVVAFRNWLIAEMEES